jgi:hypothetical protein
MGQSSIAAGQGTCQETSSLETSSDYRSGSPFAPEPLPEQQDNREPDTPEGDEVLQGTVLAPREASGPLAAQPDAAGPEVLGDGVWGQTALSAAYASAVLLAFAIMCWIAFPGGGVAVTVLGALVALMGLSSRRVTLASAMLMLHGVLFFACYLRAI